MLEFYKEIILVITKRNKKNANIFSYLSRSCSMSGHNVLPNNINHNLSAYKQHLPLLSLLKKLPTRDSR